MQTPIFAGERTVLQLEWRTELTSQVRIPVGHPVWYCRCGSDAVVDEAIPSVRAAGRSLPRGAVLYLPAGDTIRVMHCSRAERIRLYGVDGPEGGQA